MPDLTAAADGVTSRSTMVCVKPRPAEAALLYPLNMDPAFLHVTLAYLGELDGDLAQIVAALQGVAASHGPLVGVVAGYGVFMPAEGMPMPAILLPDVPGLVELRVAVTEALVAHQISYARNHGFEAHITVGYVDPNGDEETNPFVDAQAGADLHFDDLFVVRGDTEVHPLPLTGAKAITAALPVAKTENTHEVAIHNTAIRQGYAAADKLEPALVAAIQQVLEEAAEIAADRFAAYATDHMAAALDPIDSFCLPAQVGSVTDPVREAFLEKVMTPSLEKAGLRFDVTNPLTANALANTGQHIQHIAQTTQLDVMRVVRSSYGEGLSISDTAEAIQDTISKSSFTRATMIARTELAGVVNAGSLAATKIVSDATGDVYYKEWMTAPGAHYPRHETYEGLDGQTVHLDDLFDVGEDQLECPGDPNGDPGEVINCRCTMSYTNDPGDLVGAGKVVAVCEHAASPDPRPEIAAIEAELATLVAAAGDTKWSAPAAEEILPVQCKIDINTGTPTVFKKDGQLPEGVDEAHLKRLLAEIDKYGRYTKEGQALAREVQSLTGMTPGLVKKALTGDAHA